MRGDRYLWVVSALLVALVGCSDDSRIKTKFDFASYTADAAVGDAQGEGMVTETGPGDASPETATDQSVDLGPDLTPDGPVPDAMQPDAMQPDAMLPDAMQPDAMLPDAMLPDAMQPDAMQPDAMQPDAAQPDAALPDAAQPDAPAADSAAPTDGAVPDSVADLMAE